MPDNSVSVSRGGTLGSQDEGGVLEGFAHLWEGGVSATLKVRRSLCPNRDLLHELHLCSLCHLLGCRVYGLH